MPISIGLMKFNNMYTTQTHLVQAAALLACTIPLVIFFAAQKFFMQGVVVTGVDK
jgi:multiple sugar transport system permease protein